jgi:pimeloyl-ACP methyl ester carboxylesterase
VGTTLAPIRTLLTLCRGRHQLVTCSLFALAMASCGGSSATPVLTGPSTLPLTACRIGGSLPARCGTLTVAENPADSHGRRISLRVVVLPAQTSTRAPDPLFYFAGYGGAASDDAAWAAQTFARLNLTRDLVFVDQRGTGDSNRMECPGLMDLQRSMADETAIRSAVSACLDATRSTGDPKYYTTPIAVDDVDQVRAALGYDRVDIYGGSYGVSSGLAYIQRHGDHVRAALLDSGSMLDVRLWERGGRSMQEALDSILNRCEADAWCSSTYPGITSEFTTVVSRLSTSAPTIRLTDPRSGAAVTVTIDAGTFLRFVSSYLGAVQDAAALPKAIHTAFEGDWMTLAQGYLATHQGGSDPRVTLVASRTIGCSDEWAREDADRAAAYGGTSPFTAIVVTQAQTDTFFCRYWPHATGASGTVRSDAPIVFLNGTADPADPPENVANAKAVMPNSLVVPVAGYGHGQISQDPSGVLANEAITFLQFGRPVALSDWPIARSPLYPSFT